MMHVLGGKVECIQQRRLTDKTMPGEKVCLMLMTVLHSCAA